MITIIMPNYNGASYIDSAIRSVLNQTYEDWELLIIDDCSTDNSVEIIKSFSSENPRITLIKHQNNTGTPAAPRNTGLNESKGDFIAFIDSDDIWHPKKLEIQYDIMMKNNYDFSFTDVYSFRDESSIYVSSYSNKLINNYVCKRVDYKKLIKKNFIKSCSTAILKRDLIGSSRFDEDKKFIAVEDFLFWLQILKKGNQFAFKINLELTFYRMSSFSISSSKFFMIKQNYKMYKHIYSNKGFNNIIVGYRMLSYGFFSIIAILSNKIKRVF